MTRFAFATIAIAALFAGTPASAGPFDNWAALVVAGDNRAHSGAPSEVFDNARRDLVKALEKMGFAANHIQHYSAQPDRDAETKPLKSDGAQIATNFKRLTQQATGGCFIYFTTHGAPLGMVVGAGLLPLRTVADIVDNSCYDRPSVIVMSACFSGMSIPIMRGNNRMIITAARADRTSFGCGEANMYTFFDQCVLESLPRSHDFSVLAHETTDCVAARETAEGVTPASEPQLYVGSTIAPALPNYTFTAQ